MWIADFDIFWELINNDQRATTTLLPVGIESSCSLKNFSDTKFVYHKIAELLVFVGTNTVRHLLKEFAFSHLVHKISPIDCSFDYVSLIFIFLLFETQSEDLSLYDLNIAARKS